MAHVSKKNIISASDDLILKLKVLAAEKEEIRRKLAITAKELAATAAEKENLLIAILNVLDDLQVEKEKLAQAKAKNEALLASIGDGVVAADQDGKIIFINRAAERILGWQTEQLMGKLLAEAWMVFNEKGNQVPETERPMTLALRGTTTTTTTTTTGPSYFYTRKDGTRFPVAFTITPVVLENRIVGVVEIFRDTTKERDVDKAKSEFVSLASHQLRTPLTAVSWYSEMILKGYAGQVSIPKQKKYIEEIYQGNQRMIELVNTLLDVSRIELGTFNAEPEPTDIRALAESVLDEHKQKIEEKKLVIIQKLSKDVPIFSTDPKLLRMVFQNLLSNAVNYTPEGGTILIEVTLSAPRQAGEVSVTSGMSEILIKISDTGYGIPKGQQDKIFTRLFRADNVRNKDTDGTGLGLYIAKSIIDNVGGKIWFSSPGGSALGGESPENPGTTFYVTLPLADIKKREGTAELG